MFRLALSSIVNLPSYMGSSVRALPADGASYSCSVSPSLASINTNSGYVSPANFSVR